MDRDRSKEVTLAERALSGDASDIRAFVDYVTPTVQQAILRYLPAWSLRTGIADFTQGRQELFQEVMIELLAKSPPAVSRFRPEVGGLRPFVYTVAQRTCYSIVVRKLLPRGEASGADTVDPTPSAESRALDRSLLEALSRRLMASLSPADALIFRLAIVDELDAKTIARQTGLPVTYIHQRKFKLRHKAQAILHALEVPSPDGGAS